MNQDNESKSRHSKIKAQRWPKLIFWGFIATLGICNVGCNKEKDNDEYYIKYEVNSSTIYLGGKLNVILNSENNKTMTIIINQLTPWETIIGPVNKGFNATLNVSAAGTTHDKLKLYTNIYVSKNDSPFALKKSDGSDNPRDFVNLSYTIDY